MHGAERSVIMMHSKYSPCQGSQGTALSNRCVLGARRRATASGMYRTAAIVIVCPFPPLSQTLVVRFVSHKSLWVGLVEAVAELDALLSLAAHALAPPDGGLMCRPELVPGERAADVTLYNVFIDRRVIKELYIWAKAPPDGRPMCRPELVPGENGTILLGNDGNRVLDTSLAFSSMEPTRSCPVLAPFPQPANTLLSALQPSQA